MKKILFLFVAAFVCALGANAEVWKKVTSAPADWSGKYLIACDNGEDWAVLDGSRSGDPNSGNLQSTMNFKVYDVNADGDIVLDGCDYYVTIAPFGTGYSICTASGWYLGRKDDTNGLNPSAEPMLNTITLDAEQGVLITAQGGCVLRYNNGNGQDRFRYYKSSTYANQQKIALYKLDEAQAPVDPVVPEIDGYEALSTAEQLSAGTYLLLNRFGWGVGSIRTSNFNPVHVDAMDTGDNAVHNTVWIYDGEVNGNNLPSEFEFIPTTDGKFYMKDVVTGKYVNGTSTIREGDEPTTEWYVTLTDAEHRYFEVSYDYNGSKYSLQYDGYNTSWWPYYGARTGAGQPMRLYRKGGAGNGEIPVQPVVPTTTFKGVVTPNLTSVSSLAELEGIQLTFVDADQVSVLEEEGDGIYVQNADGSEYYAIWHPLFGGTYEVNGNVVTLRNFFSDNTDGYFNELPAGKATLYFEDYGTFGVNNADADWDGYCQTFSVAFEGAPVAQPFELIVKNNNIVCANGAKVEAAEAGIASDFYLGNQGLTAVGKTATLYKDGNAMTFSYTMVSNTGVSFFGGSSQITEPGTYLLEVPAGTYVDAEGNPNVAFYGQWVVIQKDEPVVPGTKDKYTIKLSGTDYYFTTTEVKDNDKTTYSISATPEYFYIEPSGNGFTIKSADTDKWVGYDVTNSWDFSNDEKVWQISSLEGEPTLIRKNSSKGFGVDNRFEGAGVYTDKLNQYWVIEKYVEVEPEPTVWNGNVKFYEVSTLDDLCDITVEFEEASSVEASGFDILGVIFDETGDAYAVVLGNGVFDAYGKVTVEGSKVNFQFQKIADLVPSAQAAAKASIAKIGGFEAAAGKASVVFAGKSFVVDGQLVADIICHEYELGGNGAITGINGVQTDANAQNFDLQGRRVRAAQQGIFLINGKKVVK